LARNRFQSADRKNKNRFQWPASDDSTKFLVRNEARWVSSTETKTHENSSTNHRTLAQGIPPDHGLLVVSRADKVVISEKSASGPPLPGVAPTWTTSSPKATSRSSPRRRFQLKSLPSKTLQTFDGGGGPPGPKGLLVRMRRRRRKPSAFAREAILL